MDTMNPRMKIPILSQTLAAIFTRIMLTFLYVSAFRPSAEKPFGDPLLAYRAGTEVLTIRMPFLE